MSIDWEALDRFWAEQYQEDYGHFFKDGSLANSSSAVGKIGRSRRPHKPEIAGSNPACAFPDQVERPEQDAGAFYSIQCSSTIKSPCNPYVEKAGFILCTNHHPITAFSFTPYDYLLADSAALDSRATFNISSAVTQGLCDRNIKQAWVFAIFPHAPPDYYDLLRRSALPSSYSGGVAC